MKIFLAASYTSKVDHQTGKVFVEYNQWLEGIIKQIEELGHDVYNALRADQFIINNENLAEAFAFDIQHIQQSHCLIALLDNKVSAGVQTEVGYAIALKKKVILAHKADEQLAYFNSAILKAKKAQEIFLPIDSDQLQNILTV